MSYNVGGGVITIHEMVPGREYAWCDYHGEYSVKLGLPVECPDCHDMVRS